MSESQVVFPCPGCVVECMQGNRPVAHWVLEAVNESVRLVSATGKESKLAVSRLLPWYGPVFSPALNREEIARILDARTKARDALAQEVDILAVWELAQGEVEHATARWLAELAWENPDIDRIAAVGHAALACKTHFRFSPPDFDVYDAAAVERRIAEQEVTRQREALASSGGEFFRALWAVYEKRRNPLTEKELPVPEQAAVFERLVRDRLADPETNDDTELWKLLTKTLPEDPHLALHLAVAWNLVPEHYNFWLDRAGYEAGDAWAEPFAGETAALAAAVEQAACSEREILAGPNGRPFISIDPETTTDIDDAFSLHKNEDGTFALTLAFACPARFWPFDGPFDRAVSRRASSLYLPEGDQFMMPRSLTLLFSLEEGKRKPALVLETVLSAEGEVLSAVPKLAWVTVEANLTLPGAQAVVDGPEATVPVTARQIGAAAPHAAMLREGYELAAKLQARRIAAGAVITERPDAEVAVTHGEGGAEVTVCHAPNTPKMQMLVGEFMILAGGTLAAWAVEGGMPFLFRSQDVALPKEFAGVWTEPEDISRIVKHLPPSDLGMDPRPHAGLGLAVYAPLTASIRRYTDLMNAGQIVSRLQTGEPRFDRAALSSILSSVSAFSETAGRIQRYRPRYWKLQFYRQMGDRMWWDAVVVEENDAFASLWLPLTQIAVRARRKTMGEKVFPGQNVQVRLGKVDPLRNEIRVMAVMED